MIGGLARAVFFVLVPAVGVGGALGIPVLVCVAGALSLRPARLWQAIQKKHWPLLLLAAFVALAAASCAWSEHSAAPQALKIIVLALLSLLFVTGAAEDQRLTRAGSVAAFFVLAVLLAIEAICGLSLNRAAQPEADINELGRNVSRGASLLLVITWGAIGALVARSGGYWKALAVGAIAASGFISLQFGQFANAVGFAAGLCAFVVAYTAPRFALTATIAILVFWLLAAPFVTPLLTQVFENNALPYSWNARLEIWSYITERIWERPWFGHGLDAARAHIPVVPVHPHSASLQIWFELGIVGVLLAAAFVVAGGRALVHGFGNNRPAAAAAAGTLAAVGVVADLSFNLWAEWWIATLFIAAATVGALGVTYRPIRQHPARAASSQERECNANSDVW